MPVAEHAEGASVHVGEVEEVVEVVGGHGAQHGQELQRQVRGHLGRRAEEVAQGPGAGADQQAPAGAQVPREGPALHVREDLWEAQQWGITSALCSWSHLPLRVPFLAPSSRGVVGTQEIPLTALEVSSPKTPVPLI